MRAWTDVEDEYTLAWSTIIDRIFSSDDPVSYPGLCPTCGQAELRYFYWRFYEEDVTFWHRGSLWLWCPACLCYWHSTAHLPHWWRNLPNLAYDELTHSPEWLETHWETVLAAGHPQAAAAKRWREA